MVSRRAGDYRWGNYTRGGMSRHPGEDERLNLLSDLTLQAIMSRIVGTLVFVAVSGGVLTLLVRLLSRPEARHDVGFTANPFTHLSLPGLTMAILFRVTWMRFRFVSPDDLKGGRVALVGIAVATLLAGLTLVVALDPVRPLVANGLPRTVGYAVLQAIDTTQKLALASLPLNLLPLPGLTGGLLLLAAFPERERQIRRAVAPVQAALVVILVLGWWPDFGAMLAPYLTRS